MDYLVLASMMNDHQVQQGDLARYGGSASEPENQGWLSVSVLQWWGESPARKKGQQNNRFER